MTATITRRNLLLAAMLLALAGLPPGCALLRPLDSAGRHADAARAKYVFLFIGDGMGAAQRTLAELYQARRQGADARPGQASLAMNSLPAQGLCTTWSSRELITDSAAAGTALACGVKTRNGTIALDDAGKRKLPTLAEAAKAQGRKVGIITSVSLDHATPACYYAHQRDRGLYYEIALDLAASDFDYFAGGGFLQPQGKDGRRPSIFTAYEKAGYRFARTRREFDALKPGAGKTIVLSPGADDKAALPYQLDQVPGTLGLDELTSRAIALLDSDAGFFIMVEGGRIDWACHANDAAAAALETLAFDCAVRVALDFLQQHPQDTLIVVTADHETGGLALGREAADELDLESLLHQKCSGPAFEEIIREFKRQFAERPAEFADLWPAIEEKFDLKQSGAPGPGLEIDVDDVQTLRAAFAAGMKPRAQLAAEERLRYGGHEPLAVALPHLLARKAGIGWTSFGHTAAPVPVSAAGAGHQAFNGYYDNTAVALKIAAIMGVELGAGEPQAAVGQNPPEKK